MSMQMESRASAAPRWKESESKKDAPRKDGKPRPLSICIINPRFKPTYYGNNYILPLQPGDKRCWMVTGALPALAALAPAHCTVEVVDENIETINFDDLSRFDIVGVTGMVIQSARMREILLKLREVDATIVVGGPYITVAESQFIDLCDVRFIGEAEETWPQFLNAYARGEETLDRYEQPEKTNMETVPTPRYDIVKSPRYAMATLQFSRGCPFLCEFCDIITIFGRRPRMKTVAQMLLEFDAIRVAGFKHVFLVDDNFIGNKVKAKELLRALIDWQKQHDYPIKVTTEASINLADDAEMIQLMVEANFGQVFIGIESPRKSSLAEIQKIQNVRGDSQLDKLWRVRDGGLIITAGFIVGFDSDDDKIFDEQYDFIQEAGVAMAPVGILMPIPTTPLYDRLKSEGRLDYSDSEVIFHPKSMSRETLKVGYADLMHRLYEPEAYFKRLYRGYVRPAYQAKRDEHLKVSKKPSTLVTRLGSFAMGVNQARKLARELWKHNSLKRVGGAYSKIWFETNRPLGKKKLSLLSFVHQCELHWHLYRIANAKRRDTFGAVLPGRVLELDHSPSAAKASAVAA